MSKNPSKSILLLDMDDVICDFSTAALALHGYDREEFDSQPDRHRTWSIQGNLGISNKEFWRPIENEGFSFWDNLEQLPWTDDLIELVELLFGDNWFIVTTAGVCPTSYDGKVHWLKRKFGKSFDRFLITPYKWLLAKPDRVLIDDRLENCNEFELHGGQSILFPSSGNYLYGLKDRPMDYVSSWLRSMPHSQRLQVQ